MTRWAGGIVAALFGMVAVALAQGAYPSRFVTVIVPFGAGGNSDVLGRIFAERMGQRLSQQFVIENRAGAGSNTGLTALARATPDGYTIGIATSSMTINPHIYKDKMPFDPVKDFQPLLLIAKQPNVVVVNNSIPAKTLPELIEFLKVNQNESYGSSGIGTSLHLCMEMIKQQTGVKITHVPNRSSAAVLQDVIGGHTRIACDNTSTALAQVKAGTLRGIAVSSLQRLPDAPELPTIAETLPGFEALTWHSYVAPAGIPKEALDKLTAELKAVFAEADVQRRLKELSVAPSGITGAAFHDFIKSEVVKWGPIIEKARITAPN